MKLLNFFGKNRNQVSDTTPSLMSSDTQRSLHNEELAAITMALYLHLTPKHQDKESEIITIDMPSAHYSPWAQKHLIHRKNPRKY